MSSIRDNTEEIQEQSTCHTNPKSREKSKVWEHFVKVVNPATNKVDQMKCIYCAKLFKYSARNGTSAMKKHTSCCDKAPAHVKDKSQTNLTSYKTKDTREEGESTCLKAWVFNQELSRELLARMIIEDEEPFSKVERPAFRRFISSLQPLWCHISRFTVARDCMSLFNTEKTLLKNKMISLNSRIALTTDIWTSIENLSYLCLTGHFIDERWVLHKRVLNFVLINSHKGKEIGKVVEKCIVEWGIEKYVSTLTVDNATANDVAINYLRRRLMDNNALILNGEHFHLRCSAHILNLIVKDGLSEVKDSISRIRDSVKYVRSSPTRAQLFAKCVKQERISHKGKVCLDVSTRWNSTYLMLDSAIKFKKAFRRLEDEDPNYLVEMSNETPSVEDWEKASVLAKFLKKFYEATKRISGAKYVTSNSYFVEMVEIVTTLKKWVNDSNACLKEMGKKMMEKFEKYYGSVDKINVMVLVATVLDPRYKLRYVNFSYRRVYANELQKVEYFIEHLKNVLQTLFEFYEQYSSSLQNTQASTSFKPSTIDHVGHFSDGGEEDDNTVMKDYMLEMENEVQDANKTELERYFNDRCETVTHDFDVLQWWKSNATTYKTLSCMARDVFAIPVSTVASESTFSTSGRVLDQFWSCLTPTVLESLICAQDWLRVAPTPINVDKYLEEAELYEAELTTLGEGENLEDETI